MDAFRCSKPAALLLNVNQLNKCINCWILSNFFLKKKNEKQKTKTKSILYLLQATVKVLCSITGDFCNTVKFFQHILSAAVKCRPFPLREGRHAERNHTSPDWLGLLAAFCALKRTICLPGRTPGSSRPC